MSSWLKLTKLFSGNPYYNPVTKKTNFTFSDPAASHTAIAFVYIYVMSFALTWACVAWVYPPEIFSMNMRGRGTSMTSATNWFVVSCKLPFTKLSNASVLIKILELLVCPVYPNSNEQDLVDFVLDLLCHLHGNGHRHLSLLSSRPSLCPVYLLIPLTIAGISG